VRQPGLVIWGECDGIVPPVYAEHFAAQITNATVHIVPDAAHMVVDEQPQVVAGLIDRLLSR
jgi:pimeloyl-ACP methyl ester carboxylesterase